MSRHPVPSAPTSDEYLDPDAIHNVKTSSSPPPRYDDVIQVSVEEVEVRFDDVEKARAIAVKRRQPRSKTMIVFKVIIILMHNSPWLLCFHHTWYNFLEKLILNAGGRSSKRYLGATK